MVHEDGKHFQCNMCESKFKLERNLKRHILCVHDNQKPLKCLLCEEAFNLKHNLSIHVKRVHEENKIRRFQKVAPGSQGRS